MTFPSRGRTGRAATAALLLAALPGCGTAATEPAPAPDTQAAATPAPAPEPPAPRQTGDPLVGSPVAGWAEGEPGLGAPPVAPDGIDPQLVQASMWQVLDMLRTANLDPQVLTGGDMTPYLTVVGEKDAPGPFAATLTAGLGDTEDPLGLVTRFAPGSVTLLAPPRAQGAFTAAREDGADGPVLAVSWTGAFAYPVRDRSGETGLVAVERAQTWRFAPYDLPGELASVWLSTSGSASAVGVAVCTGAHAGYLTPDLPHIETLYPEDIDGQLTPDSTRGPGRDTSQDTTTC